jgi:hypothetical protein
MPTGSVKLCDVPAPLNAVCEAMTGAATNYPIPHKWAIRAALTAKQASQ